MRKSIWDWLETEPTKDINKIKAAYAEVAKKYHPAEHPEEFKQLRDSYKLAIELSKKEGAPAYRVISFDTGDESFKFNLDSSKEEDKELKFDFGRNKEEDKDLKYDFRDADEAANRTKLDFSSVSAMEVLSKRQKKMLDLLEVMLSYAKLEPEIFGNAELMKAITFNWNRPPYKQEMTPAFVSALVDILKKSPLLDIGAYEVIEKLIWRGGEKPELEAFHMQFRSVKNERSNVVHKEVKITKEQIEGCFYKLVNGSTPRLYFEPSSKIQGLFKKKFQVVLLNDMLLFVGNRIRYYFCEDLFYDIKRINDQLKIYDHEKKVILSVPDTNTNYRLIVDHLNKNNSTYLGKLKPGENVFLRKANDISKIVGPIQDKNKRSINLKKAIGATIMGIIGRICGAFAKEVANDLLQILLFIIRGAGGYFIIFSIIFWGIYLAQSLKYVLVLPNSTDLWRELKRDMKKGKAFYVVGSGMYIFERYIVYLSKETQVIPIRDIQRLEQIKCGNLDFVRDLKIYLNSGQTIIILMSSEAAVDEAIYYVNSRRRENAGRN